MKKFVTILLALMAIASGARAKTYNLTIYDGKLTTQADRFVIAALVNDEVLDMTTSGTTKIYKKKGSSSTLFSVSSTLFCAVPTGITYADDFTVTLSADVQTYFNQNVSDLSGIDKASVSFYITVNEQNFPDKNFRDFVLSNLDTDGNKYLSSGEYATSSIQKINVNGKYISNLKGIEYFTELSFLNCSNNKLTSLDLSKNTMLLSLNCSSNQLTSLDLSKNTNLAILDCSSNKLTSLNVSKNTGLTEITCYENNISGNNMDLFIYSLPTGSNNKLYVRSPKTGGTDNVMTCKQVSNAKKKGWTPMVAGLNSTYLGSDAVVAVNTNNFPDGAFISWISENCDIDQNGWLDEEEIKNTFTIDVSNKGITSLKGIEYFTNLRKLDCTNNQLASLALTNLTELRQLYCNGNKLTSLVVSKNTLLQNLQCDRNKLYALSVANCTDLKQLSCANNQLTTLDVSKNTVLTKLWCYDNKIEGTGMTTLVNSLCKTSGTLYAIDKTNSTEGNKLTTDQLKVAKQDKGWTVMTLTANGWISSEGDLEYIAINSTNFPDDNFRNWLLSPNSINGFGADGKLTDMELANIKEMDLLKLGIANLKGIEHFTALETLFLEKNPITSVNLSTLTKLRTLFLGENSLSSIDLSAQTKLETLNISKTPLTSLDLSANKQLKSLSINGTNLSSLNLTNNTQLTSLTLSDQELTSLDLSKCKVLTKLRINNCKLPTLDVRLCAALTEIECDGIELTTLEATGTPLLENVYIKKSNIGTVNLTGCKSLWRAYIEESHVTTYNASGCIAMTMSQVMNSTVGTLNLSGCTQLTNFDISGSSQVSHINLSGCTSLVALYLYQNYGIETIDASGCTALSALDCTDNKLSSVNASGCTALTEMILCNNQLTSLDVSGLTALKNLQISSNKIDNKAMAAIVAALPAKSTPNEGASLYAIDTKDPNEQNVITVSMVDAAKAKFWLVWDYNDGTPVTYKGSADEGFLAITPTNFPDDNFRNWLLDTSNINGYGADGKLTDMELANIKVMDLQDKNIFDLTGIEHFTALEELFLEKNPIGPVNLSTLTKLTTLFLGENSMNSIDLSAQTQLVTLNISKTPLMSLDLSANKQLMTLSIDDTSLSSLDLTNNTELRTLELFNLNMSSLDLSTCKVLTKLRIQNCKLPMLDVRQCSALTDFESEGNEMFLFNASGIPLLSNVIIEDSNIGMVEMSGCTSLWRAYIKESHVTTYDASDCMGMAMSEVINSTVETLNLSGCTQLGHLTLDGSSLVSNINLSGCTSLTHLYLFENYGVETINASGCTAMTNLDCSSNKLSSINVSGCTALTEMILCNNQLTSLDVSGLTALKNLQIFSNQIDMTAMGAIVAALPAKDSNEKGWLYAIDTTDPNEQNVITESQVGAATAKNWLVRNYNDGNDAPYQGSEDEGLAITPANFPDENFRNWLLDASNINGYGADAVLTDAELADIPVIDINGKGIADLTGIKWFTALETLYCISNNLTSLDLSGLSNLSTLSCEGNQLTSIDLSGCSSLVYFCCFGNQLTALDVSENKMLEALYCFGNQLTSLNVSGLDKLEVLSCHDNQLTSLDVSSCTALKDLGFWGNQIKKATMEELVAGLPTVSAGDFYVVDLSNPNEGNVITKEQVADANAKGWTVMNFNGGNNVTYQGSEDEGLAITPANFPDDNFRNWLLSPNSINGYGADGVLTNAEIANIQEIFLSGMAIADLTGIKWFTALERLDCSVNNLTSLDVSGLSNLSTLSCDDNQLTSIDLSGCSSLLVFSCITNQLTSLDVFGCMKLITLHCNDNQLTSLNVSGLDKLKVLSCSDNQLMSLDVSGCTALDDLGCFGNQIKKAAMEDFVAGLPTVSAGEFYVVNLWDTNEGNVITKEQVAAAKAKGWNVLKGDGTDYEGASDSGDVNGDDAVDGTDLVVLTNIILGKNPEIPAADINGDGKVDGTDYVALVNIILGKAPARQMTADTEETAGIASALYVEPFSISAGETKEIAVRLTNPNDELTLLQFDLTLPEGLTVNKAGEEYEIDMDGRTNWRRHQLTAYVKDNTIRCLLASNSNATIDGTEGTVVRLTVTANHDFAGGTMTLHDILGVTPTEREVWMTDSHYVLSANGTTGIMATSMDHGNMTMDHYYDLNGRASKSLKKGINIVEGKKILKK